MVGTASVKGAAHGQTMRQMIEEADMNLQIVTKEMRAAVSRSS
jgi:hypothetical protein